MLHHLRSTVTSAIRTIGKMMSAQEGSLNCTRFQSPMMVANVKPTGQIKQNTGKPNTAAKASVPTSTAWRLSNCTPSRLPPTGASAFAHAFAPEHAAHADGEQAAADADADAQADAPAGSDAAISSDADANADAQADAEDASAAPRPVGADSKPATSSGATG